jgi:tRNA A37 threonylcarbamoyladenosine synthetase subunit TsaC/SUA5/YrdC
MAQFFELHPDNPQPRLLKQAVAILNAGGVIAVPTDSATPSPATWTTSRRPTACARSAGSTRSTC